MNLTSINMAGIGLSAYSRSGKPLTIISRHYYKQSKPGDPRKSEREFRPEVARQC